MRNVVFCDIDGTIIDGTRGMYDVSFKTRYAVNELKKQGDSVIIASGRNKGLLIENVRSLEPSGLILCNGAYAEYEGKTVSSKAFDPEAVQMIRDISLKYEGFYILESIDDIHIDSLENEAFRYFMTSWGLNLKDSIKRGQLTGDFHIAMIGFLNEEAGRKAVEELGSYADIYRHNAGISYDVNVKGVTKSTGVKEIIRYLDVPFENTYGFGDGINDLEMLKSVCHPVIMANSNEELKKHGFAQTGDVLHDGLYDYLVANKLIKAL
ncbi:MAG: HAD family phosphatase [Erysipelotrichaceae bacterium]|nr:HAD family phosphatase [Erysipelotrichaceae bacterium]